MNIKHRDELGSLLTELGLTGEGAEIGVGWGGYSEEILKRWAGRLWLVDPLVSLQDYFEPETNTQERHRDCLIRLQSMLGLYHPRAIYLPITSRDAITHFEDDSLDFVYIDANHAKEHALFDISNWYLKVKPGGILCGHDMYDKTGPQHNCQVNVALTEWNKRWTEPYKIHLTECTSWFLLK
jgi:hypothetical protein